MLKVCIECNELRRRSGIWDLLVHVKFQASLRPATRGCFCDHSRTQESLVVSHGEQARKDGKAANDRGCKPRVRFPHRSFPTTESTPKRCAYQDLLVP